MRQPSKFQTRSLVIHRRNRGNNEHFAGFICLYKQMNLKRRENEAKDCCDAPLAKGQVWKTPAANIKIVGLGEQLIHYKIERRFGSRAVSAQISGIEALAQYLKANQAQLAAGASSN
jgi:hypothetical protein